MPSLTATQSAEEKLTGLARLHVKAKQDRSLRFNQYAITCLTSL
jgi:hypothetical protein